jgi:RNA polymerase sigma factor (sigma-70 family)
MAAQRGPGGSEFAGLTDEELAALAQGAVNELILRYQEKAKRYIAWLAASRKLSRADLEDAQAEAVFGIREAGQKFNPQKAKKGNAERFRRFLLIVLRSRFLDFVKSCQRGGHSLRPTSGVPPPGEQKTPSSRFKPVEGLAQNKDDPVRIAEEQELRTRIQEELKQLTETERQVCENMIAGRSLQHFAFEKNMSYPQVRRLWQKIKKRLKSRLGSRWKW